MMFEELRAAIAALHVPVDGAALAELHELVDQLTAKLTCAIGEFDSADLWDLDGASSMTAWLRHHAGRSSRDAHVAAIAARRLRRLPVTSQAWLDGSLSGGQVQAIVANVHDRKLDLFAEHEAGLVPTLIGLSTTDTATAMRFWSARANALLDDTPGPEPERTVHLSRTMDGRHILDGDLDAEGGDIVATAIRLAESPDVAGEQRRTPAQRRADGLVDVCRWFLDHRIQTSSTRHRPHVNVIVDLETVTDDTGTATLLDGSLIRPSDVRRLLCDAGVHRVVTAGRSTVLDYGTTTRTIPASLWNALVVRDRHCRFSGCDRPPEWGEGHHIVHFADGGPTSLDNLVLACSRHHHVWHRPGWSVKLRPDGVVETTKPDGRILLSRPPPEVLEMFAA